MNPAPYNPRVALEPGDPMYDALKQSIETFGCVEPIVWNKRTGNIVGGHQRFKVAKDLGYTEDNVVVVDLEDTQEKSLNLALNKVSGQWDNDKLAGVLEEMQKASIDAIGFSEGEINRILENANLDIDSFLKTRNRRRKKIQKMKPTGKMKSNALIATNGLSHEAMSGSNLHKNGSNPIRTIEVLQVCSGKFLLH